MILQTPKWRNEYIPLYEFNTFNLLTIKISEYCIQALYVTQVRFKYYIIYLLTFLIWDKCNINWIKFVLQLLLNFLRYDKFVKGENINCGFRISGKFRWKFTKHSLLFDQHFLMHFQYCILHPSLHHLWN